jgi:hypothetical protein
MLGAMSLRPSLAAVAACLLVASCGGSSPSPATTTTTTTASSATPTTGTTHTAAPPTTAGRGAAPVTTTSTTSRPPEVPQSKAQKRSGSSGGVGESSQVHVSTELQVRAGGQLAPPAISVPAGVAAELKLTDRDSAPHAVVLAVPHRQTLRLSPGASATASIPALHDGTYRILVDGTPRGQLLIGAQGGP